MTTNICQKWLLVLLCLLGMAQMGMAQKLLDAGELTATSTAAYSVRQLQTTYTHTAITPPAAVVGFTNSTTPLIRVRRTLAPTGELDIGYLSSGELDTVTLKNFCGANNGFISVWYDQSGNSRDVAQVTEANQPRIVNAGVVERSSNAKIAIRFVRDGGNTYAGSNQLTRTINANVLFNTGLIGSALSVFEASSGNASAWGFGNGNDRWQIHANEGGGLKFDYGNAYQRTSFDNAANQGLLKNYAFIAPSGLGGQIWINGILVSTGGVPGAACTGTLFEIGGIAAFNNWNHDNRQSELILFNSALNTTDRTKAADNQAAYFLDLFIWSGTTSSDFSVATNWRANVLPSVTSDIYIPSAATNPLIIDNTYQVRNMTVEAGATVTISSGNNLQVSGDINHGGTFTGTGNLTLNGTALQNLTGTNGIYGAVTINNSSGVALPGSATFNGTLTFTNGFLNIGNTTVNPVVFNTITINGTVSGSSAINDFRGSNQTDFVWGSTASGTLFFNAANNDIRNLTVSSSNPMVLGANLDIVGDATISLGSTLNLQTFTLNRTAAGGVLTVNGTLQLGANTGGQTGSNYPTNFTAPPTMGASGVVQYNGLNSITQTIFATTYRNVTLTNGSGTGNAPKNCTGDFTITGTLTIDTLTTLTPGATNIITGTGATLTGKGTAVANRIVATTDFNTQYNFTTRTLTELTVNYGGAGAQTVNNTVAYGNLIISGSGTKTLGGAIDVNGNLTISVGTLTTANNQINIAGNWVNNATFTPGTGTVIFDGSTQTISGTTTPSPFHALTISSSVSTSLLVNVQLANAVGANLTVSASSIFNLGTFTANRAGGTGTLTINGTLQLGANTGGQTGSNYPTNYTAPPTMGINGVVEYNGSNAVTQTVFATTYRNLTLTNGSGSGSAIKNSTGSFTIQSIMVVNTGAVFSPASGNVITGGTNINGTGTIIRNAALATQYPNFAVAGGITVVDGTITSYSGAQSNLYIAVNSSLSGVTTVTGDITILSGVTLTTNSHNLSLTGNWTNNGTLTPGTTTVTFNGATQTIGGSSTTTFHALTISSTVSTTLTSNISLANVTNASLTISAGSIFDLRTFTANRLGATGTRVLTINGILKLGANTGGQTGSNYPTNFTAPPTMGTNGVVEYNGLNSVTQTVFATTYVNLRLSNGSGSGNAAKISAGNVIVNTGTFRIDTLTTFTPAAADIMSGTGTIRGTGTMIVSRTAATRDLNSQYTITTKTLDSLTVNYTVNNTYTVNPYTYGNLIISGGNTKTLGGAITVNRDLTISAGTLATGGFNITLSGNYINNAARTGTGTVIFAGTNQTISGSTNPSTFNSLTVNNGSTTTLAQNISIAADLNINSGGIANLATFTANRTAGGGTLTVAGTLRLGATTGGQTGSNFPTNFTTFTPTSGTVEYNVSSGGQTVFGTTYNNLTLSNTSGTQTAGANTTVNGTLSIAGTTLNMSTFTLSGATLITTGTGTIQTQNTSANPLPSGRTWNYTVLYNSASPQTIVNGNYVNLNASGGNRTFEASGTVGISGTFTTGTGTYTVTGSTVSFNGTGAQTIPAISYNNLNIAGVRIGSPSVSLFPGTINIAGDFTNTATGIGSFFTTNSTVNYNGATQTVANITYSKLIIAGTGLKTLGGNTIVTDSITIAGTTGLDASTFTLTSQGNWVNNATFTGSTSTVIFSGLSAQTISGSVTPNFNAVTINNANNITMARDISVGGLLTFTSGKMIINGQTLTLGGAVTNSVAGGLRGSIASNLTINNTTSRTLSFDQTTPGTTNLFNNLTLNNSSGTITAANNAVVNGTLLTTSGGTFDLGTNTLTGTLTTVTNGGTISTQNTGGTPIPTGKTWGGTVSYNATTGSQTVVSATSYNNLTLGNTSGTQTSNVNLVVNGTLTTTSGGVLDLVANTLSGTLTTVTNGGTITTQNTGGTPIPTGKTWGGTVSYNATTGAQTIVSATAYNTLTLGNSSGEQSSSAAITATTLNISNSGSTLNLGTNALTATTINNSGTIRTQNTTATPIPTGLTIGGTVNYDATTGGQTVRANTYNNLTLSNTSGTQTAEGNLVVDGTLVTSSGAALAGGTLAMGNFTLTGNLTNITNNGTISTNNTSATPFAAGKTWGGTGTGRLTYALTAGGQTIVSGTFNCNLILRNTGSNTNTMGGDIVCNDTLSLSSGNFILGSNSLSLNNDLLSTGGRFVANGNSNLTIAGSGPFGANLSFAQTTPNTTNKLNNFTLNRATPTITLGDSLRIGGTFTPTAGTLATADRLIIASDASGTGRIAAVVGTITGNIIAERFIPSSTNRRWRFVSSPVSGRTFADWQARTHITGTGGATNGFDASLSNQAGAYRYQEDTITGNLNSGWTAPNNINNAIEVGRGYRVFVRGDRNPGRLDGSVATQNEVTLSLTGTINSGNITLPVTITSSGNLANDGWNLVGNPYPSPYDWNAHWDAGGANVTNIGSTIYVYNPKTNNFSSFNADGDINVGQLYAGIIPSGSAFWIKVPALAPTPNLVFTEARKVASTDSTRLFKTGTGDFALKIIADEYNQDEIVIRYDNSSSPAVDQKDILKMFGGEVQLSCLSTDNQFLAANVKPLIGLSDTIQLSLGATKSGTYVIEAIDPDYLTNLPIHLMDYYTQTMIDLRKQNQYTFRIDANNSLTKGNERFELIVGNIGTPTPVLETVNIEKKIIAYPTLFSDQVTLQKSFTDETSMDLTITDVSGKTIQTLSDLAWANNEIILQLGDLATGTYFIQCQSSSFSKTLKLTKK